MSNYDPSSVKDIDDNEKYIEYPKKYFEDRLLEVTKFENFVYFFKMRRKGNHHGNVTVFKLYRLNLNANQCAHDSSLKN